MFEIYHWFIQPVE